MFGYIRNRIPRVMPTSREFPTLAAAPRGRLSPSNPRPTTVTPQQRPQPPDPRQQVTGDGGPRINAPKGAGKFLQNAYASYNAAPEKKPDSALVDYALKEFKRTHKWARAKNANDNRQLEFAVRYLLMSPKKNRYNP